MKTITQKILTIALILVLLGRAVAPSVVIAEDIVAETTTEATIEEPKTPEEPKAPESPKSPKGPESSKAPEGPKTPDAPKTPEGPKTPDAPKSPDMPKAPEVPKKPSENAWKPKPNYNSNPGNTNNSNSVQTPNGNTGTNANRNVGSTTVETDDAHNASNVITSGNMNTATNNGSQNGSAGVVNSGNGAHSSNNGSATTNNSNNTTQNNSANVGNNIEQSSVTGDNSASYNVGDSTITTGDANVTGTVVTSVNTNVDGVAIAEFNILDDHTGDIILDFGANCIQGCMPEEAVAQNTNNGAGSYNNSDVDNTNTNKTNQNNDAYVGNNLNLSANSGNNSANFNTGGDSTIITGDANVSANVMTFANNNLAGDIIYGVVNIFGDLVGDIILTEEMMQSICGGSCYAQNSAANTNNGAGSYNNSEVTNINTDETFQYNDATINNNLVFDAVTGGNSTNYNTGGVSNVTTGDASIDANVLNIANSNINGGDWWLVIVNEAGNWVGKLFGAENGSNMAGSAGTEFYVDPTTGSVTAKNNENGVGSYNNSDIDNTNTNTTSQTNTANIENNINLSANTGENDANYNTDGDSNIQTGDAQIVANIVNFVNNNVSGGGRMLVTVVNVFGSWIGDFVTPGHKKENTAQNIGGNSEKFNNEQNTTQNVSSNAKSSKTEVVVENSGNENVTYVAGIDDENEQKIVAGTVRGEKTSGKDLSEATVASIVGQDDSATVADESITINLAWLILALPVLGVLIFLKKIFVPMKSLALRGVNLFL